ncbi:NACHT domain-containing protein [Streptomyces sp. NPDC093085]|uniref:NACHT domain-containing protein n=1 Tax=Streptomyces sp. NPDC093085 TaxID=3155068 RepID=UPI00342EAC3E
MNDPGGVRASGPGSVAVAGDNSGTITTYVSVDDGPSHHPALARKLRTLAQRILGDLEKDQVQQQLRSGHPLPVHCEAAPEKFTGRRKGAQEISAALAAASPLDLAGPLQNIAAVYEKKERSQLLVLGGAGSGKSVLVRRFAQAWLEDTRWTGKRPVPVIFSPGQWNPNNMSLRDWLIDRLERDHPFLGRWRPYKGTWATELIDMGHVLVILDGFDEMAKDHYGSALRQLGAVNLPLLLTIRHDKCDRHDKVANVMPEDGLFPGISLKPLELKDCSDGLSTRWAPVLDRLSRDSGEPAKILTAVLTTPLMFTMAKAFHPSRDDPECLLELLEFDSREALENRLLDAFVPRSYDPVLNLSVSKHRRWSSERAGHWLGYLATHLKKPQKDREKKNKEKPDALESDSQDIEWWQLGTTLSLPARMLISGSLCGLVSGATVAVIHAPLTSDPALGVLSIILNVLGIGLAFGLAHGFASKIKAGEAFKPSRMTIRIRGESRGVRLRRVRECFLPRVSGGLACGFVFGIVYGGGFAVNAMLGSSPWFPVFVVFGNWLAVGLLLGLAAGIVLALTAWLLTDAKAEESVSPTDLLRTNRAIALVHATAAGLVLGFGYGAAVTYFNGLALGLPVGIAASLAIAIGVSTLTPWGRWVVLVRLWLPLSRRLPWRMNAFLNDARERGVLRQAGAVYQFRHAQLRDRLAETYRQNDQPSADGRR